MRLLHVFPFPWPWGNFKDAIAAGYSAWVCRIDSELVGHFVLMIALDEAHLLNISGAEKRQGLGFGVYLLCQAMLVTRVPRKMPVASLLSARRASCSTQCSRPLTCGAARMFTSSMR